MTPHQADELRTLIEEFASLRVEYARQTRNGSMGFSADRTKEKIKRKREVINAIINSHTHAQKVQIPPQAGVSEHG